MEAIYYESTFIGIILDYIAKRKKRKKKIDRNVCKTPFVIDFTKVNFICKVNFIHFFLIHSCENGLDKTIAQPFIVSKLMYSFCFQWSNKVANRQQQTSRNFFEKNFMRKATDIGHELRFVCVYLDPKVAETETPET